MHPAQGDLGGADQAEVGVLDRIDLRLVPARREPDPLQDTIAGQVGRDDGREARVDQFSQGELLERQVEQDGVVLEEVEAGPADLAAGLEVDQVEVLAQLDVVLGLEVEDAGRADLADLAALVLGQADGGVGMGQVGDSPQPLGQLGLEAAEPLLFVGHRRLEALAFVDQAPPASAGRARGRWPGRPRSAGGGSLRPPGASPGARPRARPRGRRPRARRAGRCGCGSSA